MPVTISYDLAQISGQQRNYIRSMFERFGWKRLGGSVFRYAGRRINRHATEDWLNDVAPALMFFRSYIRKNGIHLTYFTLDASGLSFVDFSDPVLTLGRQPVSGANLSLSTPTNTQSSVQKLRTFVDDCEAAAP